MNEVGYNDNLCMDYTLANKFFDVYFVREYAPIYKADRARLDKVRKAESDGKSEVTIQRLP